MAQPQSALRQIPTQSAEPFVRSYNPFNPAFRDTVRYGINELIGGREMGGTPTQRYRAGMADMLTGVVDFAPGIGEAVGVVDTVQAARGGNYGTAAMLGGATVLGVLPVVGGVASKTIRGGMDMSQAARMQRSAEERFFPHTLYHGTSTYKSDGVIFDEFKKFEGEDLTQSTSRSPVGKLGLSVAESPEMAGDFARQASPAAGTGAAILPLRVRADKVGRVDLAGDESNDEIYQTVVDAWAQGFDAINFTNYTTLAGTKGGFLLVKEPNQIRSINAAFDPAKRDSADLMAGAAGAAIGLSALRNIQRNEEPQPD